MSAAVTPARRLLALLDEEPSLETRPRDEIDADLATLGIDPSGPVRLARQLAGRSAGPAAALLGAMIEHDSVEAEIAALESADIADIRSRLQAGTVAAVTAEVQRRAGNQSNVVGIARRRRSAVWAWTGSLAGMAACALIVVAVWWPPSELSDQLVPAQISRAAPEVAEMVADPAESASRGEGGTASPPPAALSLSAPRAGSDTAALAAESEPGPVQTLVVAPPSNQGRLEMARSSEADDSLPPGPAGAPPLPPPIPVERRAATGEFAAGAPSVPGEPGYAGGGETGNLPTEDRTAGLQSSTGVSERSGRGLRVEAAPPLPTPTPAERRATTGSLAAEESTLAGAANLGEDSVAGDSLSRAGTAPSPDPAAASALLSRESVADFTPRPLGSSVWAQPVSVTDVLIVDPNSAGLEAILMPGPAPAQFNDDRADIGPSAGLLSDRLAEARRATDGQPIVALLSLRSVDTEFDAVLVRRPAGAPAVAGDPAHPLLTRWFGDRAAGFALIVLAPGP